MSSLKIRHLDIISGSGNVGLESLPRGATHCTFADFTNVGALTNANVEINIDWEMTATLTGAPAHLPQVH
jgi:16S rRNA G966 N2-methylase RsmD